MARSQKVSRRWPQRPFPVSDVPRRRLRSKRLRTKSRPLGGKGAPLGQVNLLVPASPAQRDKVAGSACLVCGRTPADAAHLVPQWQGGCASELCVLPLDRGCHKRFDAGGFDLRPYLGEDFKAELEHALTHVDAQKLERGLSGGGWGRRRRRGKR